MKDIDCGYARNFANLQNMKLGNKMNKGNWHNPKNNLNEMKTERQEMD